MAFRYSCFISYVHSGIGEDERAVLREFVRQLRALLAEELDMQVDLKIFRDREQLIVGQVVDPALGKALCESASWLMVYVPKYADHDYCRREFQAMCLLEERRRRALSQQLKPEEGMIIPVVLRGELDQLPEPACRSRVYLDFRGFDSSSNPIRRNKKYATEVRRVAEYVAGLCKLGDSLGATLGECGSFDLPASPSREGWPDTQQAFPNR